VAICLVHAHINKFCTRYTLENFGQLVFYKCHLASKYGCEKMSLRKVVNLNYLFSYIPPTSELNDKSALRSHLFLIWETDCKDSSGIQL
jgi:hypothetical protein